MLVARAAAPLLLLRAHATCSRSTPLLCKLGTPAGRAALLPPPGTCAPLDSALPAAAPGPWRRRSRRLDASRCLGVQQVHADAASAAAASAAAAAAAARRWIRPGEVHLWWLDPRKVHDDAALARCRELLTPEELADCEASAEADVRRSRVLARALVRSVLAGYLPGAPHPRSLLFDRNPHGKPHLLGPAVATPAGHKLRFNLTHTPSMIGLAITVAGLVGLDVEGLQRRTRGDPMRLARRRFSPHEIADLQACADEDRRAEYFLQLWTLKEAYVKALGRGISAPPGLRSFGFRVGPPPAAAAGGGKQPAAGGLTDGCRQDAEQQEQRQPNVPPPPPQQQLLPLLVRASNGEWRSSGSTASSGSVDFLSEAPEPRRWAFALLQPAPGLVSALCVEHAAAAASGAASNGSCGSGSSSDGEQPAESLRLLCFEAEPGSGEGRLVDPQLLAIGKYP